MTLVLRFPPSCYCTCVLRLPAATHGRWHYRGRERVTWGDSAARLAVLVPRCPGDVWQEALVWAGVE